jgi:hypothetical protein
MVRVRFQVLTGASMKVTSLGDIALLSIEEVDRRFRGCAGSWYYSVNKQAVLSTLVLRAEHCVKACMVN